MDLPIADLNFGKVDAKLEFAEGGGSLRFVNDHFYIPDNVRIGDFRNGSKYFIRGFRGTGKTSLLRYCLMNCSTDSSRRHLTLFKSNIDEDHRTALSREVGFDWVEPNPGEMEISQDFKSAWRWFVLHKIGELLRDSPSVVANRDALDIFLNLLGLGSEAKVKKVIGIFPKIKSGLSKFQRE